MAKNKKKAAVVCAAALLALSAFFLYSLESSDVCRGCNVIIISVDTLRADHLGVYGYGRETSPAIDEFAKKSVVYTNVVTPRAKTNPSLASMFTGLYPFRHGVRNLNTPLGDYPNLALALSENGYYTAAFVSNWFLQDKYFGMAEYFDVYDARYTRPEANRPHIYERDARETNEAVLKWLSRGEFGRPFFLWVHYMDPHGPYTPPKEYMLFENPKQDMVSIDKIPPYQRLWLLGVRDNLVDANEYRDRYDAEIRHVDDRVGELLSELEVRGLLEDSVVLFTADHGESLGQHDYYFEHGAEVYDDCSRVPFILYNPRGGSGSTDRLASLMDVMPTLLHAVGLGSQTPEGLDGVNLLGPGPQTQGVFMERYSDPPGVFMRVGYRTSDKKITYNIHCAIPEYVNQCGGRSLLECYDLESDPTESVPLDCSKEPFPDMKHALFGYLSHARENSTSLVGVDPDVKALKALGYMN